MKKSVLSILLFSVLNVFSQNNFKKAYFITNAGERVVCFIDNVDWKYNPTKFKYRINDNDKVKEQTIKKIKEFGIYSISKFIRVEVDVDQSSDNIHHYSYKKKPLFSKETVFLKVLTESEASLFYLNQKSRRRFFYQINGGEIRQLVYKKYVSADNVIHENEFYKQQLRNSLKCQSLSLSDFNNLRYQKEKLLKVFNLYNSCKNSLSQVELEVGNSGRMFNLSVRAGIGKSALSVELRNAVFDSKLTGRFGFETELVLPYYNNKWSLFVDPTYQYYKAEKSLIKKIILQPTNEIVEREEYMTATYQSIMIPVGLRQYFVIDKGSKWFIDASFVFDFSFKSSLVDLSFQRSATEPVEVIQLHLLSPDASFVFGVGYINNDRYSLSFRYNTEKSLTRIINQSKYRSMSVVFGYRLF